MDKRPSPLRRAVVISSLLGLSGCAGSPTGPLVLFPPICREMGPKVVITDAPGWVFDRSGQDVVIRAAVGARAFLEVRLFANDSPKGCSITGAFGISPFVTPVEWVTTDPTVLRIRTLGDSTIEAEPLSPGEALIYGARFGGWGQADLAQCGASLDSCLRIGAIRVAR